MVVPGTSVVDPVAALYAYEGEEDTIPLIVSEALRDELSLDTSDLSQATI